MKVNHRGRLHKVILCWRMDCHWFIWNPPATNWSPPFAEGFVQVCDRLLNGQIDSSPYCYWNGSCYIPLKLMVKIDDDNCHDLTETPWLVKPAAKQIKARLSRLLRQKRRKA